MSKLIDIIISIGLNIFLVILWGYELLVTSDAPVKISFDTVIIISILLLLCLVIYSIYLQRTKYILLNLALIIAPLLLWFMSMKEELTYHYHPNNALSTIGGFSITMIIFIEIILKKIKKN